MCSFIGEENFFEKFFKSGNCFATLCCMIIDEEDRGKEAGIWVRQTGVRSY